MKKNALLIFLLFLCNFFTTNAIAQTSRNLQGLWEGTLDQNKYAANHYGYEPYYKNGAFSKNKPTHFITLDILVASKKEISGTETKILATNTKDFASFSFKGVFKNGFLKYDGNRLIDQNIILSLGYCTSHANLKYSEDADFEYLTGSWKGTFKGGYCADAIVFLKKAKQKVNQSPILQRNTDQPDSSIHRKQQDSSGKITKPILPPLLRMNSVIDSIQVTSPEIEISLFDNGDIDGDTVTVYHNGKKIIDKQVLGLKALVYTISANSSDRIHVFTLVAENLGSIPPNTAYMRITAGEKNYKLLAKTNLNENAVIKIEYTGK